LGGLVGADFGVRVRVGVSFKERDLLKKMRKLVSEEVVFVFQYLRIKDGVWKMIEMI